MHHARFYVAALAVGVSALSLTNQQDQPERLTAPALPPNVNELVRLPLEYVPRRWTEREINDIVAAQNGYLPPQPVVEAPVGNALPPIEHLKDYQNVEYEGWIEVGTPPQKFMVVYDTGSANFWIASSVCHSKGCSTKRKFDHSKSGTYKRDGRGLVIQYGTGDMRGVLDEDVVSVSTLTVEDFTFGEATYMADFFAQTNIDGILGMAFRTISQDNVIPLFQQMVRDHVVNDTSFAFFLSNKPGDGKSELTLGGYNPAKFKGELEWHPLSSEDYWSIIFQGLKVGDQVISQSNAHAIVDSGTSLIVGPLWTVERLLMHIRVKPDCSNIKELPDMEFIIGRKTYTLEPDDYVIESDGQCFVGIQPMVMDMWILGDVFMRKYYSVFQTEPPSVGFALANHDDD